MAATARIAAEHRSFTRIRQVAPTLYSRLTVPWANANLQPLLQHGTSIGSAVFAGFTHVTNTLRHMQTHRLRETHIHTQRTYCTIRATKLSIANNSWLVKEL